MTSEKPSAGIPAAERALVGLCHGLNDRLAALSAYAFILERRGVLGELDLQSQLDDLAHKVRLVRSLSRSPDPDAGPLAVSLIAEEASLLMESYPDGRVVFTVHGDGAVVRCDWTEALRAMLLSGAWIRRGCPEDVTVEIEVANGGVSSTLTLRASGSDLPPPPKQALPQDPGPSGILIVETGPREVTLTFS